MDLETYRERAAAVRARAPEIPEVLRGEILALIDDGADAKRANESRAAIEGLLREVVASAEALVRASTASDQSAAQLDRLSPLLERLAGHLDGIAVRRAELAATGEARSGQWAELAQQLAGNVSAWHVALLIILAAGLIYGVLGLPMPEVDLPGFGLRHDPDRPLAGGGLAAGPSGRLHLADGPGFSGDDDDDDSGAGL